MSSMPFYPIVVLIFGAGVLCILAPVLHVVFLKDINKNPANLPFGYKLTIALPVLFGIALIVYSQIVLHRCNATVNYCTAMAYVN